jgi:type IV pilus assembly protein PilV
MKTTERPMSAQRGFMLLEVLVALLIFSVGVLGVVGLQASMTKAQTGSKYRADAAFLAQRLLGTIWADVRNRADYATANCSSNSRCSEWSANVATVLPNGTPTVTVAGDVVTVSIAWTPPNEEQHAYTTTSVVVVNP